MHLKKRDFSVRRGEKRRNTGYVFRAFSTKHDGKRSFFRLPDPYLACPKDAAYFFGATQAQVKDWLSELPVSSVVCEGRTYFILDEGPISGSIPDCMFLAGFDPLMLGYQKTESLYLPPEHLRGIFSLAGIVMPALLLRGRVAGRWKRTGKKLRITAFEPLSREDKARIAGSAEELWSGVKLEFQ